MTPKMNYDEACATVNEALKQVLGLTGTHMEKLTGRSVHLVMVGAIQGDGEYSSVVLASSLKKDDLANLLEELAEKTKNDPTFNPS